LGFEEEKEKNEGKKVDQKVRQPQSYVLDPPELALQHKRGGQERPVILVLALDSQLLAEITELEGRTERIIFIEQKVVLEIDLVIPDQIVVERSPVDSENNHCQQSDENDVSSLHGSRLLSFRPVVLFFF
jgi:hypothetical protein